MATKTITLYCTEGGINKRSTITIDNWNDSIQIGAYVGRGSTNKNPVTYMSNDRIDIDGGFASIVFISNEDVPITGFTGNCDNPETYWNRSQGWTKIQKNNKYWYFIYDYHDTSTNVYTLTPLLPTTNNDRNYSFTMGFDTAQTFPIIYNDTGFTHITAPTEWVQQSELNITLEYPTTYVVETVPYLLLNNSTQIPFVKSGQRYNLTYTPDNTVTSLSVEGKAVINPIKTIDVTYNTTGFTFTTQPTTWQENTVLNVVMELPANYEIQTSPYLLVDGTTHIDFTQTGNTFTLNITPDSSVNSLQVIGSCTIITGIEFNNNTIGLTFTELPTRYNIGDTVNIECIVSDGYVWQDSRPPYIEYTHNHRTEKEYLTNNHDNTFSYHKQLDYPQATITSISINGEAVRITPIVTNYGLVRVYHVSSEILTQLANKRYLQSTTGGTLGYVDLMEFAYSIRRYYFSVTDGESNKIQLGRIDTNILAPNIEQEYFNLETDEVIIPDITGNSLGYDNRITLYIPFVGVENLPREIVGHNIKLNYYTNILSGKTTCYVLVDGVVFETYNAILYAEYPRSVTGKIVDIDNFVPMDLTPKLNIFYPQTYERIVSRETVRKNISDVTGFCQIHNIEGIDNTTMFGDEYNLIVEKLSSGVFI